MLLRPAHRLVMQRAHAVHLSNINRHSSSTSTPSSVLNAVQTTQRRQQLASAIAGSRSLATAVDSNIYDPLSSSPVMAASGNIELPKFDVTQFVVPEPIMTDNVGKGRRRGENQNLPSEVTDLVAVFEACLQVHKLDRAALVLRKLNLIISDGGIIPVEYLIYMHNEFIRANLEYLRSNPNIRQAEALHQWYELYIRRTGLPHTAETIAYMLRASILSAKGNRLSRFITRYMDMCPGELGLQVLGMVNILSAQDLAVITEACPRYNFTETVNETDAAEEPEKNILDGVLNSDSIIPEQFPGVLSTPQKGLGLKFLKETLKFFHSMPENLDISTLSMDQRREIQSRMEKESIDSAIRRWREEHKKLLTIGLNTSLSHHSMSAYMFEWHKALEAHFRAEVVRLRAENGRTKDRTSENDTYSPLLLQADCSRLAATTLIGVINAISIMGIDHGASVASVCNSISKIAEEDIQAQLREKQEKLMKKAQKVKREVVPAEGEAASAPTPAEPVPTFVQAKQPEKSWTTTMRTKVGAFLLSGLFEHAKVTVTTKDPNTGASIKEVQAAFSHAQQLRKGKKIGIIIANPHIIEVMKSEPQGDILAKHLPMLVPPKPWAKYDQGAYLEYRSNIVRAKGNDPDQRLLTKAAVSRGDLAHIAKGLDILGQTAWRVNQKVLNVLMQAWNSGEAIVDLPPLEPDLPIPPEPADTSDAAARRTWIRQVKMIENERSGLHSNRCFINFQLEIARAYRNQAFYFPHNMDFRGRAYPLPTYLNHMGADHVRGILQFATGRPLGENGLRWLKIHLANVAGYDKASLDEREAFAMEHLLDIFDSAENPLSGKRWWLQSEDAWQTLAACFELKAALDSPDPTKYVSSLPIHQDGTCNGLQHYAALGGDMWGARQVNLEPGERPADVYSAVANLVNELVDEDVKKGNSFAEAVHGKITRKVVKQTVMTNVYGVTFQGAKKQVAKQLDAYYPNLEKESGYGLLILGSYIAQQIFKAMSTMFRGAQEIQSWLGEVGGRVCNSLTSEQVSAIARDPEIVQELAARCGKKSRNFIEAVATQFNTTIVWTTPLRLPVSQPYRKSGTKSILTCLQDMILADPNRGDPVDRRKQLQAFPPNFIHSLDASHMLLSALRCNEKSIEFAAVHDSFWTHAADIDTMNVVLRDSFIDIHNENVIGRLAAEFRARYKGSLYLGRIAANSRTGQNITTWRRATKSTLKEELQMEELRRQLLASEDPDEVERGKKMVTPATIVAANGEDGLLGPDGKESLAMGNVNSADASDEVDSTPVVDDAAEEAARHQEFKDKLKMSTFEMKLRGEKMPFMKTKKVGKLLFIWLPLEFPQIPAKGDFDVARLRDSKYFFS